LLFFSGCQNEKGYIDEVDIKNDNYDVKVGRYGDDLPVTRAVCSKMLSFLYNSKNEIELMDRKIVFNDTDIEKWYDKYINCVFSKGIMSGVEDGLQFKPDDYLTLEQAQILLDKIIKKNKYKIKMNDENKNKPISYALWNDIYIKMVQGLETNIYEKEITVLVTNKSNEKINQNYIFSDVGPFEFDGFDMSVYMDKKIKVICRDNQIISIEEIVEDEPTIKNIYIIDNDSENINIFTGGVQRSFKIDTQNDYSGKIADISIKEGVIKSINVYDNYVSGIVKLVDNGTIELAGNNAFKFDDEFKIYDVQREVKWKDKKDIICGASYDFIINDNKVCSAVIKRQPKPAKIRVVLNKTNFDGLLHENVILTSNQNFVVKDKESEKNINKGEEFKVTDVNERVYVYPENEGKIIVKNIVRNGKNPEYRGVIEVSKKDDKYIIVNELDLEEYLYAVVTSEMPSSYGEEACKVQAVAARSYAYNQFYNNRFAEYGANVDDSANSQVYNNISENNVSINAVNSTKGLCITYNGNVINANFFSTSCGITADSGDVWANYNTMEYPAQTPEYLKGKIQGNEEVNLNSEESLKQFLKSKDVDCYEKNFPWFRWSVKMTKEEITKSVNENINKIYENNIHFVKTLDENGDFKSKDISNIGDVTDIEIVKRGNCGNIMEMKISGTKAIVMIYTEQNIRNIINPKNIALTKSDSSVINDMDNMPSSFYCFDKTYDQNQNLKEVQFYGGGYGHGVGMSQNGVLVLLKEGYDYKKIIEHFYSYTNVESMI